MSRIIRTLLALIAFGTLSSGAAPAEPAATTPAADRLSVSFLTADFLAQIAARIQADRIVTERLAGGHLQEETGLIWARQDNGTDLDWYAAGDYCDELEKADWADWRMPTIDELERLHDRRSEASYKLPATIRLTGCCPWSSSRNGDSSAWNFSFRYRKRFSANLNLSYELRALCVRAASEADVLFYEEEAEKLKDRR